MPTLATPPISSQSPETGTLTIPRHVAVIMDGNGRWAQKRGLPRISGHEAGSKAVGRCVEGCLASGVEYLTLYAFSAENWKRPPGEVRALMLLLERFLEEKTREMIQKGISLHHIGRMADLPAPCQRRLKQSIADTAGGKKLHLTLALSYGGRSEIVDAVRALVDEARNGAPRVEIDEALISSRLYTRDMPDPDLLIRTSGEMRVSNFLLWQLSYTEIHVTQKLWPDFAEKDLQEAIADYSSRSRRYGGV